MTMYIPNVKVSTMATAIKHHLQAAHAKAPHAHAKCAGSDLLKTHLQKKTKTFGMFREGWFFCQGMAG